MTSIELSEAEKETELKKERSASKSSFTLYRNRLLLLIEEPGLPRTEVNSACRKMDSYMESSMEVMSQLSDIYIRNKQLDNATKIVNEMEKLEEEFHSAYETVWKSLSLLKTTAKSVDPWQRKCSMEEPESVSLRSKEELTQQTVSYGNKHERESRGAYSIGEDLWSQLKRIQLPVFTGEKRSYRNWKAAFMACVDTAPAIGEYKLLQLRQCLSGEALNVIENLGHSATAYEAAKERLERRYGGKRRQVAIYLEDLDKFHQIRPGNAQDLEQFADLLEIAIMNLEDADHHNELGDGYLYCKLRTKLTESMLAKYHRWVFETKTPESVIALKTWVFEESAFQTIASETVHGVTDTIGSISNQSSEDSMAWNSQRTFFGEMINHCSIKNTSCQVCGRDHKIWTCQKFMEKNVSGRWATAKSFKLCFRCLGDGHIGKACQRSRPCGQNGCQKSHHVLLHRTDNRQGEAKSKRCLISRSNRNVVCHNTPDAEHVDTNNNSTDRGTFGMEGNHVPQTPPMELICLTHTQDVYSADSRGLPTVTDGVMHGERRRAAENSTIKTCTNPGIAAELVRRCKSEDIVSSRSGLLNLGEKSAHLIGDEDQEILQVPMEGNFTE